MVGAEESILMSWYYMHSLIHTVHLSSHLHPLRACIYLTVLNVIGEIHNDAG